MDKKFREVDENDWIMWVKICFLLIILKCLFPSFHALPLLIQMPPAIQLPLHMHRPMPLASPLTLSKHKLRNLNLNFLFNLIKFITNNCKCKDKMKIFTIIINQRKICLISRMILPTFLKKFQLLAQLSTINSFHYSIRYLKSEIRTILHYAQNKITQMLTLFPNRLLNYLKGMKREDTKSRYGSNL